MIFCFFFFFSSRRRHTRYWRDWSSDVCSSDLFDGEVKRYVQTMNLRNNPELIAQYREAHSNEKMWREILQGIREVGILEMEIYILGCQLVMICDLPASVDWNEAMTRLTTLPRQAEWEAHVAQFQGCDADATSDEKWQMMERMFHLYDK